jgi:hypothetical protein
LQDVDRGTVNLHQIDDHHCDTQITLMSTPPRSPSILSVDSDNDVPDILLFMQALRPSTPSRRYAEQIA